MLEEIDSQQALGRYVRSQILPRKLSVKAAAERLKVGRPALSNLLNGKAALSPEMAARLASAFGADSKRLLEAQDRINQARHAQTATTLATRRYAPNFLTIKASQISKWADGLDSRSELPVLLRRLIRTTGDRLLHVEFHGYDNAQRHGWDGWVEAEAATAWIPKGKSGWEFGVDARPGAKAEHAYRARTRRPATERADCTFVFVTPRDWKGKTAWEREKNAERQWKAVRVFDASDIEQWLEDSVPAQMWLYERLGLPTSGWSTLDECWKRWSEASRPPLHSAFFDPAVAEHVDDFKRWLDRPPDRVFVVAADSTGEGIAFLSRLCSHPQLELRAQDHAAVLESPQALKSLAGGTIPLIAITANLDVEEEYGPFIGRFHCVAVRPRNDVNVEPDIALRPLRYDAFRVGLAAMSIAGDEADRLDRDSGRSPSILRRLLATAPALKSPHWARDPDLARSVIPMALIGAWQTTQAADKSVLERLAETTYAQFEQRVARLLALDDTPIWSAGQFIGVRSKLDACFALKRHITSSDLDRFFSVAQEVLDEEDPALELPEEQRWAAAVYGKAHKNSAALRRGIYETLVILASRGDALFGSQCPHLDARVAAFVRTLLEPLTLTRLLTHSSDLPHLAEAAPEAVLDLVEEDLAKPEPVIAGILRSSRGPTGPDSRRTGLLWALEGLAWRPDNLPRVAGILARLSQTRLDDNLANKPISSLQSIFLSRMPQTAAAVEHRIAVLKRIVRDYPAVGWQLCLAQFTPGSQFAVQAHRPLWRDDAVGAGHGVTRGEYAAFVRAAVDLALSWNHDESTLGDLIAALGGLPHEHQQKVWDLITRWANTPRATDPAKAALRERIRRHSFTRRGLVRESSESVVLARAAMDALMPVDAAYRHLWLFLSGWVEESADEIEDDGLDYNKREERIAAQRVSALAEIWQQRGLEGIGVLLSKGEAAFIVGYHLADLHSTDADRLSFITACQSSPVVDQERVAACVQGYLNRLDAEQRTQLLTTAAGILHEDQLARLLRCAPFIASTWRIVESRGPNFISEYWKHVTPEWRRHDDAERSELIDRLLGANRPRAAFSAVHRDWDKVETSRLIAILRSTATQNAEPAGSYPLAPHDISRALKALEVRPGASEDDLAQLEFRYLDALRHSNHGLPNLARQIARSPALYAQFIALAYKRSDDAEDPPEWRIQDEERRANLASAARDVLDQITTMPGTDAEGRLDTDALHTWVIEVRATCTAQARTDISDYKLGELLARGPCDADGTQPSLPVSEVLERIASKRMAEGYHIETRNSRGAHWRGEGGAQEREIAERFRLWASRRAFEFPFVSRMLDDLARSYDHEAERHDTDAVVNARLRRW